ncbi:hypothetical protein SLEP1_g8388 [Rubroshorea leprosula]|uniref:Uncharacterized protein n=1 Tax=Rubroshorea leprosula TaxID=152421 RepID=A0AAV5IAS8_9ROSI|nr:hypothetical protein SLEP1_g8388 [Rubroshorea leprosula]
MALCPVNLEISICSIGSYLCILEFKGDRIQSLVDEPKPCDQSVINSYVIFWDHRSGRGSFSARV